MALIVGTTYEVVPKEDTPDPDFTYPSDDKEEWIYAMLFLAAFGALYETYKDKGVDYAIANIEKDTRITLSALIKKPDKLNKTYRTVSDQVLVDAGILKENLKKAKLNGGIKDGILEQKETLKSITNELSSGIKAKAHFLKNRGSEEIFNVKSNFNRAAKRTKDMAQSGYRTTKEKAKRAAQIFLYGDPDAYWICLHDGRTCPKCLAIERDSPMPLSKMPMWPLHVKCGQRCEVRLAKDISEQEMTDNAIKLTYYDMGVYDSEL